MVKRAFTMAEILISLTIIGIIAAITLPALQANINEKTWATKRKALYSRMSQAISIMPSLNGYGIVMNTDGTVNYSSTNQKAATAFVTDGLNKVLKINNICDSTNLSKCGMPSKITVMGTNNKIKFPEKISDLNSTFTNDYIDANGSVQANPQKAIDTVVTAFEISTGEAIAVFYNPLCQSDMEETEQHYTQPKMCANFLYDLNGKRGPNKVGKDIGFMTALYQVDSSFVAPMPLEKDTANGTAIVQNNAAAACRMQDTNSRVPNKDELTAIFYNKKLLGGITYSNFWSSTVISESTAWAVVFMDSGTRQPKGRHHPAFVRCIKR